MPADSSIRVNMVRREVDPTKNCGIVLGDNASANLARRNTFDF
jgi:hypothetical protein